MGKYLVQLVIPCITGTIIGWDGIIHFNFAKDTGTVACLSLVSTDDSSLRLNLLTQSHSQDY